MGGLVQPAQKQCLIKMQGISRDYFCGDNVIRALADINCAITKGEFIGIMGPSASGKSTLLNIIGCLDSPTAGQYCLAGKDIKGLSQMEKASIRNNVFGFVFQSINLLPMLDIAANVALPLKYSSVPKHERKALVSEALKTVGLANLSERYPDQLSGGQQQKVAIARALVNQPDVILADEPTGNLDSASGQSVMEELRKLRDEFGRTVIVVTHDPRVAGYADRLIRLKDGTIVEDMPIQQIGAMLKNPFAGLDEGENNGEFL